MDKLAQYAVRVWGAEMNFEDPRETALEGVRRLSALIREAGLPWWAAGAALRHDPVVRATGGLKDSIQDSGDGEGNGFTFQSYNGEDMLTSVHRALEGYAKPTAGRSLWSAP